MDLIAIVNDGARRGLAHFDRPVSETGQVGATSASTPVRLVNVDEAAIAADVPNDPGDGTCNVIDNYYHVPGQVAFVSHNLHGSFKTRFTHRTGQSSAMGNGLNLTHDDIGWYQSGKTSSSRHGTAYYRWAVGRGWRSFRTEVREQWAICNHPAIGGWSQKTNEGQNGGAWLKGGPKPLPPRLDGLCAGYGRGGGVRVDSKHATTYGNGIKGKFIHLSSKTGYSSRAVLIMKVISHRARDICGRNAAPEADSGVGFLVGQKLRR